MRVEVRRDAVACEIVVDGQLVEGQTLQNVDFCQFLKQRFEEMRDFSLSVFFIDLVSPVLELITVMLHSTVVQLFPLSFVDFDQQLRFFFLGEDILHHYQSWNS